MKPWDRGFEAGARAEKAQIILWLLDQAAFEGDVRYSRALQNAAKNLKKVAITTWEAS